jgi:hypothetical protein
VRDGYRVSSKVQGEWDASSIPREVWGEWVRLFLGDVKDQQTSRVFLSPIHVSCVDCDYVRLVRLGSFPKAQGYHVCLLYGQRLP